MQLQRTSPKQFVFLPSGILIVEPNPTLLLARAQLLLAADYYVDSSNGAVPASKLQETDVRVAILSQSLGIPIVAKLAQEVRLFYPNAAILIIGLCSSELNDQLYDEMIDSHSRSEQLLDALFRLKQEFSNGLVPSHARIGSQCLGLAGLDWISLHGVPAESDPSKDTVCDVESSPTSRDLPADETAPHLV